MGYPTNQYTSSTVAVYDRQVRNRRRQGPDPNKNLQLIAISGAGSAPRESRFASWKSWAEPVMPPPARASHAICERLREALMIATDINIIAILFAYRCPC